MSDTLTRRDVLALGAASVVVATTTPFKVAAKPAEHGALKEAGIDEIPTDLEVRYPNVNHSSLQFSRPGFQDKYVELRPRFATAVTQDGQNLAGRAAIRHNIQTTVQQFSRTPA